MSRAEQRRPRLVWVYTQALTERLDAATWLETTRHLRELGWNVTLLSADPPGTASARGVALTAVKKTDRYLLGQLEFHARVVRRILREWSAVDVVLFHQISTPWLLPLRLVRLIRRSGPRLALDTRTLPMTPDAHASWRDRLRRLFYGLTSRIGNHLVDGRLAITRRMAEAERIPARKLWGTWPSAADVDRFGMAAGRRRWPSGGEPIHLIYVGVLHYERNLLALAQAVERAHAEGLPYVLWLIGGGSQEHELQAFAAGTGGRVRVLPPVPHEEVPNALARAHVGVLPFPDEEKFRVSSPIKLYEYMASGLAVLATRIVCHTDVVGAHPAVVWADGADVDGLLAALRDLWRRRAELAGLGESARSLAAGWTWEASARRLDAALRAGLAQRSPGSEALTPATEQPAERRSW